ncbi:MAG TPA: hypothetical protein VGD35_21025 [Chitinophaga sp.]
MTAENAFPIVMPAETLIEAVQKLTELYHLLHPYLRSLTPEERQGLVRMEEHTIPFIQKTVVYARTQPQFAPPFIALEELQKNVSAVAGLTPLFYLAEQLHNNLDDTMLLCGSEAYSMALGYYHSVKRAATLNVPDADVIYNDLQQWVPGRARSKAPVTE